MFYVHMSVITAPPQPAQAKTEEATEQKVGSWLMKLIVC